MTNTNNLTIGQIFGILPLYSKIPARYQYKSRLNGEWKDCKEHEIPKYQKYLYETRNLFN